MTLLDPRLPYFGKFSSNSSLLVLKVLRRDLEARLGNPREMTCHAIKGSQPENGLVSAFLDMLPAHAGNLGRCGQGHRQESGSRSFSVSWAQTMEGRKPRVSSVRGLALLSLHAAIGARLADPALDAQIVAAAAGVSVRYANALLAEQDMLIMRLVHAKRLEQCQKALEDPLQTQRMISEIAHGLC